VGGLRALAVFIVISWCNNGSIKILYAAVISLLILGGGFKSIA